MKVVIIKHENSGQMYLFKIVKPEIPLALDGGMNGVRGNYYKLLEKQKSSQSYTKCDD